MKKLNDAKSRMRKPKNNIEIVEHVWIEMSDGIRLSAKIWMPQNALEKPVPAILEMIPYRKRDYSALRDHLNHAWFAARGYACIRPDMRGHGDSEGIMLDEYLPLEQQDTVEVIKWLSEQVWCDGNVGMMGLSWGGIASLQAAIKAPRELKAIIPVGASVDRYYDDGGYLMGGYPGQGLGWGGVMFGYCIRPPDPNVVGDAWRKMWMERLKSVPMYAKKWLTHQTRDSTWKQGSICEDYDKINVPVLGVSGWNDCWPNTMLRLLENIKSPCLAVSGAWGHVFPNLGGPGPMIGFLQLALDWWDYWLKGINNGVMDGSVFLAYLQESHAPDPNANDRPGKWVGESCWPTKNVNHKIFALMPGKLQEGICDTYETATIRSPLILGMDTGEYMPISGIAELPNDQSGDDGRSICFDTDPLPKEIDLLGTTKAYLRLSSDSSCGLIAARICDVAPNGTSTLITYGILNLKQRDGRETLSEITPKEQMDVVVRLNDVGWSLKAGHRLRLALSSQLWPMAWPVAEQATLTVELKKCHLELPVRKNLLDDVIEKPFGPPITAEPLAHQILIPSKASRILEHNLATGETVYNVCSDAGLIKFKTINWTHGHKNSQAYRIIEGDPLSARIEYKAEFSFSRDSWSVRTESELQVTCDTSNFFLKGHVAAFEGDKLIFTRDWDEKIERTVF